MPTLLTRYIGVYENLPETGTTGDICYYKDKIYIFVSDGWIKLSCDSDLSSKEVFNGTFIIEED